MEAPDKKEKPIHSKPENVKPQAEPHKPKVNVNVKPSKVQPASTNVKPSMVQPASTNVKPVMPNMVQPASTNVKPNAMNMSMGSQPMYPAQTMPNQNLPHMQSTVNAMYPMNVASTNVMPHSHYPNMPNPMYPAMYIAPHATAQPNVSTVQSNVHATAQPNVSTAQSNMYGTVQPNMQVTAQSIENTKPVPLPTPIESLAHNPYRYYEPFIGPFDPCPPMKVKRYVVPINQFINFQPANLPQFPPAEALHKGTLWQPLFSPYEPK